MRKKKFLLLKLYDGFKQWSPPIILMLLGLIIANQTFGQTAIDAEHNSMRTGDIIKMYKVQADDIWNLSDAKRSSVPVNMSFENFKTDSITLLFNGTRKYYALHSDSLLYLGSESPLQIDTFYIPEVSYVFPVRLKNKHTGVFACYTNYCDKMRFHKFGCYSVQADTIGTLTLPGETIVNNVLQISHKRSVMYEQLEIDSTEALPIYSEADISQKQQESNGIYIEIEKELYAKGFRYPIVKDLTIINPDNQVYLRETYYTPIDDNEGIFLDERNKIARTEVENGIISENDNVESLIISLLRNNTATKEISFDCEKYIDTIQPNTRLRCRMLLSDNRAIVYRSREFLMDSSNKSDVSISYSGLRPGHYVMSLIINDQIYTENFIFE